MSTQLHTFMDLFSTEFPVDDGTVVIQKIIIPIIQRDYAQGRLDADVTRVRKRFLQALRAAVRVTHHVGLRLWGCGCQRRYDASRWPAAADHDVLTALVCSTPCECTRR